MHNSKVYQTLNLYTFSQVFKKFISNLTVYNEFLVDNAKVNSNTTNIPYHTQAGTRVKDRKRNREIEK